jgi:putative serine protease PepD
MATTFPPPQAAGANDHGPSGPGRTEPPIDYDDRRPPRRWPGSRSLAVLLTIAAFLGGAASTGVLALTGAIGNDAQAATATVVPASTSSTSGTSNSSGTTGASVDAKAIYASASTGVVDITASGTGTSQPSPFGQGSQPGPYGQGQGQGSSQSTATGTGFVVDGQGHIVTAAHVIDGATSIKVTFSDGVTRTATLVGRDDATDVAVLKVNPSGLTLHPLKLGSSAALGVGDALVAIGSPFGYQESVSTGIVSGLDRTIQAPNGYTVAHAIQTDAALNPGNSGGPIFNSSGRVIGVADQIATGGADQSSGVGFAVPIDLVAGELGQLEAGKTVSHAYLGVGTTQSTGTTGASVGSVTAGSPAASAGLKTDDVVTAIDGKQITGTSDLVAAIAGHSPGDKINLTVRRGSNTLTLTATLGTQPATQGSVPLG